jgi:hypothetical protein
MSRVPSYESWDRSRAPQVFVIASATVNTSITFLKGEERSYDRELRSSWRAEIRPKL